KKVPVKVERDRNAGMSHHHLQALRRPSQIGDEQRRRDVPERVKTEKNIRLGLDLLALRSNIKNNIAYGRQVRQQFDIEQGSPPTRSRWRGSTAHGLNLHPVVLERAGHTGVPDTLSGRTRDAGGPYLCRRAQSARLRFVQSVGRSR